MTEPQHHLFAAQRGLLFAQRRLEEAIALGNADVKRKDLKPGNLIFMPDQTNREFFQAEVDACQCRVDDCALTLRRDTVLTKWAWRALNREQRTRPAAAPRRKDTAWMQPMSPDQIVETRRLVEV